MHPSRGPAMNNVSITDSSVQELCEKKDYCDSANTDSGFLSGHNLNTSENITSGEYFPCSGNIDSSAVLPEDTKQSLETTDFLVDSGVISDVKQDSNEFSIMDICERFDRLMKRDWIKCYQQDEMGDTQLHLAVCEGNDEYVSRLISNVPRQFLNLQNDASQTALHLAVLTDQPKIVRRLLSGGSNQTIRDADGNTALHLACARGKVNIAKELLSPLTPVEIPQGVCNFKATQDLELWNYDGKTCAHLAAESGSIEILRYLIIAGADINAREGKSGLSPLHISIERGNEKMANFLLDECPRISLNLVTYSGLTAYQLARIQDKRMMVNDLTKRGAEQVSPPESDVESDSEDEMMSSNYYGASTFPATFSGLPAINVS